MHRTTILIPEDLRRDAEQEAARLGISLSELIRRQLKSETAKAPPLPKPFFTREAWTGSTPADIATNHDHYLYGE